jgi:hypothetical protein
MPSVTFLTRDELEGRLVHAIDDPDWRASMSNAIASRVREYATHDALAASVMSLAQARFVGDQSGK